MPQRTVPRRPQTSAGRHMDRGQLQLAGTYGVRPSAPRRLFMRSRDEHIFLLVKEPAPGEKPETVPDCSSLRASPASQDAPRDSRSARRGQIWARGRTASCGWLAAGGASFGLVLGIGGTSLLERHASRLERQAEVPSARAAHTSAGARALRSRMRRGRRPGAPSGSRLGGASVRPRTTSGSSEAGTRPIATLAVASNAPGTPSQEFSFER
jgi:hypothetical protein